MEKIDGVDLSELVEESSTELVTEKRRKVAGMIKQQLQRVEQLSIDVKELEKQLRGKKEKLDKALAKIKKVKEGDWSVLVENKEGKKKEQQQ